LELVRQSQIVQSAIDSSHQAFSHPGDSNFSGENK